jgi:mannose-6-phosphate isomerase-like protein (cupin superfamily)
MHPLTKKKFPLPVSKDAVARSWSERGYSCEWFIDPPGREWNNFVHHSNELVTVIDGLLEMTVAGITCLVEPGDEVFIPRRSVHSVRNVHSGITRWLYGYD